MRILIPFSSIPGNEISLVGNISRKEDTLQILFELRDPRKEVIGGLQVRDLQGSQVEREDGLWKSTCFEAFWGEVGSPAYWELNLSPSGDKWNLYRFSDYRVPQPPARSEDFELKRVHVREGIIVCELQGVRSFGKFEASLCAVVCTESGPNYFSVSHAGTKADFHLRKSFFSMGMN